MTASEILAVDEGKRPVWRTIAERVRDYPTMETKRGKGFTAYEGNDATYHFPLATMMVFPGDDIGLHSPAPLQATAPVTVISTFGVEPSPDSLPVESNHE